VLDRSIGLVPATAMVVGIIIGASIFVQPSVISAHASGVGGVLGAWVCAGVLTLIGALVAAELASAYPRSGGVYVFLREAFSPAMGFLWGWAMFWSMHTAIAGAIAVVFGRYAAHLLALGDGAIRPAAIVAVLALSGINVLGVRQGSRLQTALTALKVAAVLAIVALLFTFGGRAPRHFESSGAATATLRGFGLAVGAGLFAFGGWHMVTYTAGETVEAPSTVPRALVAGTLLVTACYLALNLAYLYVLPLGAVAASRSVAADAVGAVLGGRGDALVTGVVVLSTLGALNGVLLAGPRVYHAMAQDGLLFAWAGAVHPRFLTPARAIIVQALWAGMLIATNSYGTLYGRVVTTEWVFFGLMAVGLVLLRRRAGFAPSWRLRGGALPPLLFAAAAFAVAANQVASAPLDALTGLGLIALGLPVHWWWTRRAPVKESAA